MSHVNGRIVHINDYLGSYVEKTKHQSLLMRMSFCVISLMFLGSWITGCAEEPQSSLMQTDPPLGANQTSGANQFAVGALLNPAGTFTGCSVAFIDAQRALTAARCVASQPNGPYSISLMSPVTPSSMKLPVSTITIHPLWNSTETTRAQEHVSALSQGQLGYYTSAASYDIAVLTLSTPKTDTDWFEPLRVVGEHQQVETLYFLASSLGVERTGGVQPIQENTPTTLTTLLFSTITTTMGGGAALINLDNGRAALAGIASGGDGRGTLFTRVTPHLSFISDVIQGVYSPSNDLARYRVSIVDNGEMPIDTNPGTNPMPTFDCAMMSDGFCDANCRSGADPDCMMDVEQREGVPFGASCIDGDDCLSRLCLGITEIRFICSARCNPYNPRDCPMSFDCIEDVEGEYVCAPEVQQQQPGNGDPPELRLFGADCSSDAQCTTRACIEHGGSKWCSQRCMQDSECPVSYVCGMVTGGRACVPPE